MTAAPHALNLARNGAGYGVHSLQLANYGSAPIPSLEVCT